MQEQRLGFRRQIGGGQEETDVDKCASEKVHSEKIGQKIGEIDGIMRICCKFGEALIAEERMPLLRYRVFFSSKPLILQS